MEAEVINIAVSIFQNVGIKRWIDQIESLRNQQIYFEICKIIFPETMIRLFKINQSDHTTGEKIQEVIDMISKMIRIDLYHISGQAIAQGNLHHLKNFLQLLEALSQPYIKEDSNSDPQSAPQIDTNKLENQHSFYTVIGIPHQFQNKPNQQEQLQYIAHKQPQNQKKYALPEKKNNHIDVDADQYLPPKGDTKNRESAKKAKQKKKKKVAFQLPNKKSQKQKIQDRPDKKTRAESSYAQSQTTVSRNNKSSRKESMKDKKVTYINKTSKIMEELEKKKTYDENHLFKGWKANKTDYFDIRANKVNFQAKDRNRLLDIKLLQREKVVNSIKENPTFLNYIVNAFKMEKKIYKQIKKQTRENQIQIADQIMNDPYGDEAQLQKAALSSIVNFQRESNYQ